MKQFSLVIFLGFIDSKPSYLVCFHDFFIVFSRTFLPRNNFTTLKTRAVVRYISTIWTLRTL